MRYFNKSGAPSFEKCAELAKATETYAFDSFSVPDESPSPPYRDPCVCMTVAALNTKRIQIESAVFNPYTRHPALLAVLFASLAEIAEGRLVLGLGPGGSMTLGPLKIEMWSRPLAKIRESVFVLRRLLSGEKVDFDGDTVKVQGVQLAHPPSLGIPIYLAARGPKMLELAGEIADGVLLNEPIMLLPEIHSMIRKGAEKTNRRIEDIRICSVLRIAISKDEKKAKDDVRGKLADTMGDVPKHVHEKAGIETDRIEAIKRLIKSGKHEAAASLVTDEMVDFYAVAGTVSQCTEKLDAYFKSGANQVDLYGLDSVEEIKLFGKEIIPVLKTEK